MQVASSIDDGLSWGASAQLRLSQYNIDRMNNIYFSVATPLYEVVRQKEKMVGLFPGVVNKSVGGVFITTSDDGVNFGRPQLVMRSALYGIHQRTADIQRNCCSFVT